MVSAAAMNAIAADAGRSATMSPVDALGRLIGGNPAGRLPTTGTSARAEPNNSTRKVAPTIANRAPGMRDFFAANIKTTPRQAIPIAATCGLVSPRPRTISNARVNGRSSTTSSPRSLGSWLKITTTARPAW